MSKPIKETINGDDAANVIPGTNKGENIFGLGGNDTISSWGGNDTAFGGAGDDVVNGGRANDWLFGEAGNDSLVGESGDDHLLGGEGDDLLLGASGNDILDGGAGSDTFLVSKGGGLDRVENFAAEDKIDLGAFRFGSAQEAIAAFEQNGLDAVLELGDGGRLVLANTQVAGLTADQFDVSPYLTPTDADPATPEIDSNVSFVPLITVGDTIDGHAFTGIPDGLGAFDNGDGTFTVLVNHEFTATNGAVRDHGFAGAYVSKLVIDKETLDVLGASDLIRNAFEYDPATGGYVALNDAFNRFCSADLALETAFYNQATGLGYNGGRLFLNGEESGPEGRAFAHIASGAEEGDSYELAWFGNLAFENVIANPGTGDKTVVAATDDGLNGQVYFYFGDKKASGNAIDRAGLTGGSLYGLHVAEIEAESNNESDATNLGGDFQSAFTLVNLGDVSAKDGATLDASSETLGVTSFLRPEDGAWDTIDSNRFYFVTTNAFGHPSRLWAADFVDASDPSKGGTVKILLDGSEGQQMFDNITVGKDGKLILSEDVGNQDHLGKVWKYDPSTGVLEQLAQHDPARFAPGGDFFLTRDEESSGVIDVTDILGSDTRNAYLIDAQAHFNLGGELVQGGQLLVAYQNEVVDDFSGTTRSELLLENKDSGAVVVARVGSDGQAAYSQIAALGPEWSFRANGDFLGDGSSDFLVESQNGDVVIGDVVDGQAQFTQVATPGSGWTFVGAGDYLGAGFDQFLLKDAGGAIFVGDAHGGAATYTQIAALGSEWEFVASGDFLGEGHDEFLIENKSSGAIVVGDVQNGQAAYSEVAALGSEWKFVGTGDFLGKGFDQFLIKNPNGAVVVGDVQSGQAQYTEVGGLGSEWSFIGAGDYLGTGTAGFAIENGSGAVFLGSIANGSASYSQIGALGSEWVSRTAPAA